MTPPAGDPPLRGGGAPTWGGSTIPEEPHIDEAPPVEAVLVRTLEPKTPAATDPGVGARSAYHLWKAIDNQATAIADIRRERAADREADRKDDRVRSVVSWLALLVWVATGAALIGGAAIYLALRWWS